ncbi:MAG TPA: hypothetical protein VK603_05880 [Candidatus Saccharimonadales bacterium]|nr:hypothetical protein [Candidatus Saccharimonadales bacterium]
MHAHLKSVLHALVCLPRPNVAFAALAAELQTAMECPTKPNCDAASTLLLAV